MLDIKRFTCNMLSENCYVVSDETKACVIIDCGAFYKEETEAITGYIEAKGLKPVHLLCTHGHFDHIMGNAAIGSRYGLKAEAHQGDEALMTSLEQQTQQLIGVRLPLEEAPTGRWLTEQDSISMGSHTLKVIHTPGHSPGCIVFYCEEEKVAFSGDTLFRMSIGRTDLEGGSYEKMTESLRKLATLLSDDTTVYPGHGPQTVMKEEKLYNPYLR